MNRGAVIDKTYQLNFGGNSDFLNMLERKRLKSKKISKTEAVQSQMIKRLENEKIHIGPSDFVPWLDSRKIAYIRIEGRLFGDVPFNIETRLDVEDKANSSGVLVDSIRCLKIALDRGIGGPLISASAYFCKHPPIQLSDDEARKRVEMFIDGKIER
jgi:myo-inositol-1-phosphate synthase